MTDTIYALSTSQGRAGIAVVRISGPDAFLSLKSMSKDIQIKPRKTILCDLFTKEGLHLDRALVISFKGPNSFTGEDVVELHIHGSIAVIQKTLETLSKISNFRQALPGEFTRRALLNEKLNLAEIEGLADLIEAETEAQRVQALKVLSGKLGERAQEWRSMIIKAMALIEVTIDFADEEVPTDVSKDVKYILTHIINDLDKESKSINVAERIRTGFEVAIVGKPNVGKSTLLNAMAGREAAITSEQAGTTRDIIEVRMDLDGLPVTMLDTAGLRETNNLIETKGITRAIERANSSDLVVMLTEDGETLPEIKNPKTLTFISKCDEGGVKLTIISISLSISNASTDNGFILYSLAKFKTLSSMTSQTATISTSLIFLNAVAWALAIPPVPTIANLIIFYNYDLLDILLPQLAQLVLFSPYCLYP